MVGSPVTQPKLPFECYVGSVLVASSFGVLLEEPGEEGSAEGSVLHVVCVEFAPLPGLFIVAQEELSKGCFCLFEGCLKSLHLLVVINTRIQYVSVGMVVIGECPLQIKVY